MMCALIPCRKVKLDRLQMSTGSSAMAVSNDFTSSELDLNGLASIGVPTALVWGPDLENVGENGYVSSTTMYR
jgi:hypothetical protein